MRQPRGIGRAAAGVVFVLVVAACGGLAFYPVGNYAGDTVVTGNGTIPTTATITATSTTAGSWDFQLVMSPTTYTGSCLHTQGGSAGNLTCTGSGSSTHLSGTFTGDLTGNTWSGSFTDSAGETGWFSLTR